MSARPWVEAIEKAGGVENAMLHGAPLKALLAEVDELRSTLSESLAVGHGHKERANSADERASNLTTTLAQERAALAAATNENEPLRDHLKDALAVVEAARWERKHMTVSARMDEALMRYDLRRSAAKEAR